MTSRFRHVALIGKYQASGARAQADARDGVMEGIGTFLESQGCTVFVERSTCEDDDDGAPAHPRYEALSVEEIGQRCDLGLVVGGDGTMLGIGRQLAPYKTPLIGVNHGRLGFITDIPLKAMQEIIPQMLAGQFEREERSLLEARIMRDDKPIYHALAFNDVVVNRSGFSGMAELRVSVDGHFMYNQRSDGLIVATPTGSTAYALSSAGPILHPQLQGFVLVPIAPHSLSNRPIVLPDDSKVTIQIIGGRDVNVNFDMQSFTAVELNDAIEVRRSKHTVPVLHPVGYSTYATLRKKLHWNEHPSQDASSL